MNTEIVTVQPAEVVARPATSVLEVIARAAADPAVDVTKMSALLDLQERYLAKEAEKAFSAALVAMQSEVPRIRTDASIKNRANEVQSRYATYEGIDTAVRPIMQRHGFAVTFDSPELANGMLRATGTLHHIGGHSKVFTVHLPIDASGSKNGTQGVGSTKTYAKRYLLIDMLNIAIEEADDDGNGGAAQLVTPEQAKEISDLAQQAGIEAEKILLHYKVGSFNQLTIAQYNHCLPALRKRIRDKEQK